MHPHLLEGISEFVPISSRKSNCTRCIHCGMAWLSLILLYLSLSVTVQAEYIYTTNNGALTVTSYYGAKGNVVIPSTIGGLRLTTIGKNVFCDYKGEPDNLIRVTIPRSVTNIENGAFHECPDLTAIAVEVENPVYSSRDGILLNKSQTTLIKCPRGKVGSCNIPSPVRCIETNAFLLCHSLNAISVEAGNAVYSSMDGVLFNKDKTELIQCPLGKVGNYAIPSSVTSVKQYAFTGCLGLTNVTIPSSVAIIGDFAFASCTSMAGITLPDNVISIGNGSFANCRATITVNAENPVYSSRNGVLFNKSKTTLIKCSEDNVGSYTVPNSVTNIEDYAFLNCSKLTDVTIPDSVLRMGREVFSSCSSLTNVTLGNRITAIDNCSFDNCRQLASVSIPDSVTRIGHSAFQLCSGLTNVTFGNNVTTIETYAFDNCRQLASVSIPDSVTNVGYGAFVCCKGLTNLLLGKGVTSIGADAFAYCTGLTQVTVPDGVTSIGGKAFVGCSGLTNAVLGNQVTSIGDHAFADCYGLQSVSIPDSVTNIGAWAFANCTNLVDITLPNIDISIGSYAFEQVTSVSRVLEAHLMAKYIHFPSSQYELGFFYSTGRHLTQSDKKAALWYRKAAEQGYGSGQLALGICYYNGKGVDRDYAEAAKWLRSSAEQGNAEAQFDLGICYNKGQGVVKDIQEAYGWYLLAAARGHDRAPLMLESVEKLLSPLEQRAAREWAKQWKPKGQDSRLQQDVKTTTENDWTSTGSGFFISENGYFITANHVVSGASRIVLNTSKGTLEAKVITADKVNDVAILKVSITNSSSMAALNIPPRPKVTLGQTVFTVGFPNPTLQGINPKLTKGEISALTGLQDDVRAYQISIPVQPGNSGGVLADEHACVLGVVVQKLNTLGVALVTRDVPQNVNYALKISYAYSLIDSIPGLSDILMQSSGEQLPFEKAVQKVQAASALVISYGQRREY